MKKKLHAIAAVLTAVLILSSCSNGNLNSNLSSSSPSSINTSIDTSSNSKLQADNQSSSESSVTISSTANPTSDKTVSPSSEKPDIRDQSQSSSVGKEKVQKTDPQSVTVYITRTGHKYHCAGCRYLSRSEIPISLAEAKAEGYTPCSVCNPPQ